MEAERPTLLEPGGANAIGRMLGLLGDEWTLLIMRQALQGVTRYGQFMTALPISNSVLTSRLGVLTRESLLEREVYQTSPLRAEYLVTARGRSLWPVMLAIWEWERHWVPEHASALPTMRHTGCERDFAPVITCRSCGKPVEARRISAAWGPSGSWERSVPHAVTRRRPGSDGESGQAGLFPQTMTILGNRWSSALIGAAFRGVTRFSDFESSLGAPPTLVAGRLKAFCAIGVLEAARNAQRPDRAEYHLTEKGRAFFPAVAAALQWGERWFAAPEGPALVQVHRDCGDAFSAMFCCDQCGEPLAGTDIAVIPVPGDRVDDPVRDDSRRALS